MNYSDPGTVEYESIIIIGDVMDHSDPARVEHEFIIIITNNTKSSIIVENVTNKTVRRAQGELSWMAAGMHYIARQASIHLNNVFDAKSDKEALFVEQWTPVGMLFST